MKALPPHLRSRLHRLFPTLRQVLVQRSLQAVDRRGLRSVLVVGSGEDPYRRLFPDARTYIRSDLARRPGVTDVVGDALSLPFPDRSFQCAVATEVLEYVQQPQAFATELHRILSDKGLALVTVPFVFHEHGDRWRPTRRALGDLFRAYASVRICAQGNRLHTMIDLLTTAFSPYPLLFPLRVFSHLLLLAPLRFAACGSNSTAPSGFLVVARK